MPKNSLQDGVCIADLKNSPGGTYKRVVWYVVGFDSLLFLAKNASVSPDIACDNTAKKQASGVIVLA
jgi:hypothetical protein